MHPSDDRHVTIYAIQSVLQTPPIPSWAHWLSGQGRADAQAGALQPPKVVKNPALIVVASVYLVMLISSQ